MSRLTIVVLSLGFCLSSGCVASKKYVRKEVQTSADGLTARIDAEHGEIKETQDAVHLVRQRVTEVDGRVTEVDGKVAEVDGKVATVDSKVTAVDGKVAAVDGRVAGVDNRVSEVDTRVAAVNNEVRTVDTHVNRVDSRVDTVNSRVSDLDVRTGREINTLETGVAKVDNKVAETSKNLVELDDRFAARNMFEVATTKSVKFRFDSATLDKSEMDIIKEVASILSGNRDAIVILEGHTDSTGDRDYNITLGERRARAVRSYLAASLEVAIYRIHEIGLGTAKAPAPNDTPDGRQQNRSVTMTVLIPASAAKEGVAQAGK